MAMFKKLMDSLMSNTIYYKKKKTLRIPCKTLEIAKLFEIIGGKNVTRSGKTVTVNVSQLKDVEQALGLIEIVAEVK